MCAKCVNKVQLPSSPKNRVCVTDKRIIGAVNQDDGDVGIHTKEDRRFPRQEEGGLLIGMSVAKNHSLA